MKEYNELTNRLLAEGYTADNHPKYVQLAGGAYSENPLQNIYGGFEYKEWYRSEIVYTTGCGKCVFGENVLHDMGYMGVDWCHENENPVIRCPYDNAQCELNNPLLHGTHGGGLCIQCWCECHRTDEVYDYENSIEKANKERQFEKDRKYKEYSDKHNGRVCINHMGYDERTKTWKQRYSPSVCASRCYSRFCPIRGRELNERKGNVFYDLKTSGIVHDGTLFDGSEWVNIRKGIRFFEHPISMDICEDFVKLQSNEIFRKYKWNKLTTLQLFDKTYKAEILNIRAESKPSRDLMKDLDDLKNGIHISHESDNLKKQKEVKKEKRKQASEKKIQKLKDKILKDGYEKLEAHSLDKVHADKWLGEDVINELEYQREIKLKQESEKPKQMSIMDFIGGSQ